MSNLATNWYNDGVMVSNVSHTGVLTQSVRDARRRETARIFCAHSGTAFDAQDTNSYLYNIRGELTNAVAAADSAYRYGYDFDDIGNRNTASERGTNFTYAANNLNQYTTVGRGLRSAPQEEFVPQYDADGNQTLVKTFTGIWSVAYNGENRLVLWTCLESSNQTISNQTIVSMSFDRMGRRVAKNDQRFVYNGYLQIADNAGNAYVWDVTEPVATRPLVWLAPTLNHQLSTLNLSTPLLHPRRQQERE